MVSDLGAGIGERDLNILEEITNLGYDVRRRNRSSESIKNNVYKKTSHKEKTEKNIKDDDVEKWLIPKRTLSQKKVNVNSNKNEIELKNKYNELFIEDDNECNLL